MLFDFRRRRILSTHKARFSTLKRAALCCFVWSLAAGVQAEGDCSMEDCQQFKAWTVGRSVFASGRIVYMAETDGYYSDQAEHRLAFVYTPGRCSVPQPYLRYPMRTGRPSFQASLTGRFRVNAADWYEFSGRLLFPEGRVGTGLFETLTPSPAQFVEAVKAGLTLNSVSFQNGGRAVLHEYRLDGSTDALNEAQRRCEAAPPEVLRANTALTERSEATASADPQAMHEMSPGTESLPEIAPVSQQCQDLSFLDNPIIAMEFDRLNGRLRSALGFALDALNIPYEFVCQDLMDGFSADGIAELLIERYLPDVNPQQTQDSEPRYEPRWYDERPRDYQPYYAR